MTIFDNLTYNSSSVSFIAEDEKRFTYNDLLTDADYHGERINERSLIFIISRNNYNCVTGYVGGLRVNAVVALINDLIVRFKPSLIYQPQNMFSFKHN